jgi:hypothetical protein
MKRKVPTLKGVFDKYNRLYFDGKLKVSAVRFARLRVCGETTFFDNADPVIEIDRTLLGRGRFVRMILLHEMAHVELGPDVGHGRKFVRRLHRLVRQGAYDGLL